MDVYNVRMEERLVKNGDERWQWTVNIEEGTGGIEEVWYVMSDTCMYVCDDFFEVNPKRERER